MGRVSRVGGYVATETEMHVIVYTTMGSSIVVADLQL